MGERLVITLCEESYDRYIHGDFIDKKIGEKEILLAAWAITEQDPIRSEIYKKRGVVPALITHDESDDSLGGDKKYRYCWVSNDNIEVQEV